MERPGIVKMMNVVREDFKDDMNNTLIGFIAAENGIEEKNIEVGEIYVVYLANNDFITAERLVDMYDYITES